MTHVYNMDNMEYMRTIPDGFFDLAVVDPPYGIGVNVNMGRRKGEAKTGYHKFAGEDKAIQDTGYFKELFRVSKNQVIFGGNYFTDFLYPSPCWLLWDKKFSADLTFAQFEMAWTSFQTSAKKIEIVSNVLGRIHPTQKPVALYKWVFKNYAKPGYKILDTHVGSQSSRIAADMMGFEYHGTELDTKYFNDGNDRFAKYKQSAKASELFSPEEMYY